MEIFEMIKDLQFTNLMWEIATPLIFSLFDIITGYIQAIINKSVDSQKMRTGLLHKVLIIMIIILSFVIQFAFDIKYVANIIAIYVVLMEAVSILENLKKAGINIGKFGNILKEKTETSDEESLEKLADNIKNKEEK